MTTIDPFPSARLAYLPANVKAYWSRQQTTVTALCHMFKQFTPNDLIDLPSICCGNKLPPLTRYPILCATKEQADKLYSISKYHGLGVSRMYQKPLNEIEGLEKLLAEQGPFPNAKEFADLLLTFPTHCAVPASCVDSLGRKIFSKV